MDRQHIIAELTGADGAFETHQATVVGVPMTVYSKAAPSMRAAFEATQAFADREFLVCDDERWTYGALHRRVLALANLLHARGIRKGDRVAIGMRNHPEWVLAFWATQAIGAVAVTSGTTGRPKGALATHRNHVTNLTNSFLSGLYVMTAMGSKLALMYKWHPDQALELVQRERVSSIAGVPDLIDTIGSQFAKAGCPRQRLRSHRNDVGDHRQRRRGLFRAA